jgi:tetratricopeptide (TPR) repeat protein
MLDAQAYGLKAGGYHLTNVLLHAATTVLLFLVLRRMTVPRADKSVGAAATPAGALWPSAFVAAVFAIHPLRVESVAWVTERKDMLSGLFFVLTLGAYVRYVEKSKVRSPKSRVWYGLMLLSFTLGLLSKPTLVTLPFLLLLLDYWPLARMQPAAPRSTFKVLRPLIIEKIPLFVLSAASCVATVLTQQKSLVPAGQSPLSFRLGNAAVSYITYLGQMIYPAGLAVVYPYPEKGLPLPEVALALVLLTVISVVVIALGRRCPYLLVGWLWYLGMLVPMIGVIQAGFVVRADRFTYLSQIGIYLLIAWGLRNLFSSWRYGRQVLGIAAFIVIASLMVCASVQTSYWRNSESLWIHTLACTSRNVAGHSNLGSLFADQGRIAKAIEHYQAALEIEPDSAEGHNNLGTMLAAQGHAAEAIDQYLRALEIEPNYLNAHYNLGNALLEVGRTDQAIVQFRKALEIKPDDADTYYNLGIALMRVGRPDEAISCFQKVIEFKPDSVGAYNNLALVLFTQGRFNEAVKEYQRTLELMPNYADAHYMLGCALQGQRKFAAAIVQFQEVLKLEPGQVMAQNSLAWLLATCPEATLRDGGKAIELAKQADQLSGGNHPEILDALAAAYAEAGRYPEAVETARRALSLLATQNNKPLADALQMRLKLYEANAPFHEKP